MTTTLDQGKQKNSVLALFFLGVLAVMLIPLPPILLDAML